MSKNQEIKKNENQKLRKERKTKKKELKELLNNNKYIENLYDVEDKKSATRRYNTLNNRRKFLDKDTCKFLENLGKKNSIEQYNIMMILQFHEQTTIQNDSSE